jgi:TatD DNase family protein
MFTDTHAHLAYPGLIEDLPGVIQRAKAAGVERIVSIATTLDDARHTLELTCQYENVFAAVGLHPGEIPQVSMGDIRELARLASGPKVVAIGETGLDYYRGRENQRAQKDLFWAQLELARQRDLPVVIHNRAADHDCLEIVRQAKPRGVMHCFSGDEKFAFECLDLGLFISFTGILTFQNAGPLRAVARKLPLDKIMLETDAPYLAPVPHRGRRNEPAYVPHIAAVLAELKGTTVEEIARVTSRNAERLFQLKPPLPSTAEPANMPA